MPARTRRTTATAAAVNGSPVTAIEPTDNDAKDMILAGVPYEVAFTIRGNTAIIFHRWSVEGVAEKAAAPKGSTTKKTDDLESYVWRNEDGEICIPHEYVRQAICNAARSLQDPRSPRKSARDLFLAGLVWRADYEYAPILWDGQTAMTWEFVDQRRVNVRGAGITRSRPAFNTGWEANFRLQVLTPEYISFELLLDRLTAAGRFIGLAENRPSYGRFQVTSFAVQKLEE